MAPDPDAALMLGMTASVFAPDVDGSTAIRSRSTSFGGDLNFLISNDVRFDAGEVGKRPGQGDVAVGEQAVDLSNHQGRIIAGVHDAVGQAAVGGGRRQAPADALAGTGDGHHAEHPRRPRNVMPGEDRRCHNHCEQQHHKVKDRPLDDLRAQPSLKIGAVEMVSRCNAAFRDPPGTRLAVHMNPRHLHLFDADSGAAL